MEVVIDQPVGRENAFFEPTSKRHQTDMETTWKRHRTDIEATGERPKATESRRLRTESCGSRAWVLNELFNCERARKQDTTASQGGEAKC